MGCSMWCNRLRISTAVPVPPPPPGPPKDSGGLGEHDQEGTDTTGGDVGKEEEEGKAQKVDEASFDGAAMQGIPLGVPVETNDDNTR